MKEYREGLVNIHEDEDVFLNPHMQLSRDMNTLAAYTFFKDYTKTILDKKRDGEPIKIADPMSASGIRAIRYAKELEKLDLGVGVKLFMNDHNPEAVKMIKKNLKKNKLQGEIAQKNANDFLTNYVYEKIDLIDLDPFGAPSEYLESVFNACTWHGMLCITATDLGALAGKFTKASMRKYSARGIRPSFFKETSIRMMLAEIIMMAAKQEYTITPLFSQATRHYVRIYCKVSNNMKMIDKRLKELGFIGYCSKCEERDSWNYVDQIEKKCKCGGDMKIGHFYYLGKIHDEKFVSQMLGNLRKVEDVCEIGKGAEIRKMLGLVVDEIDVLGYHELHILSRRHEKGNPKLDYVIEGLKEKGFEASRTYFSPTAFKTNASVKEIIKLFPKKDRQKKVK